ncbi:putative beta-glucosidase [Oceanicola granulosus HTCC2516]|uniref:Beta-D-glucoside glucohydrolase n=1 Tax=Oceanicola granulosus (strain ATCC BAA-861 / DSM 15982 / KCTC 12143 / HTCC2516) TaxID=314256 RepID=Q2CCY5_OCEGH|nr:glycoside hydrolase family 3 C-terminal domain-containing protein [Oceanicola granulosus]EAR50488.1 putative beta-glucosidase [Oceanicola granulosus HTCC2516]
MPDRDPIALAADLTLEEQVRLLSGQDDWSVAPVERLGIGSLRVTDGPNGARGGGGLTGGVKATAFPVGIAIGASWNIELVEEIGAALADEARDKSCHVLLAPTINLQRGPLNGRNFECYSEDPYLTARLAVGYIRGLQDNGIAATPKHFVGNESEIQRTTMSSEIDERALRELYLVPFEAAVKEAGTWAIMSSYNRLNGTYTSEHPWLLNEVLRDQWGYDGVVMSDWFGSHTTAATINAGLDLEMPGPTRDRGDKLVAAVEAGEVAPETIATRAANMLRLMQRTGAIDDQGSRDERAVERDSTRALVRRAGAEATVLLKNNGILPLSGTPHIAVVGPNAPLARAMGGGSAQLNAHRLVSPAEGLRAALGDNRVSVAAGCDNHRFEPVLSGRFRVEWFANTDLAGAPVHVETVTDTEAFLVQGIGGGKVDPGECSFRLTGTYTPDRAGLHRAGIHCAGRARLFIDDQLVADAWDGWTRGSTFFEEGNDPVVGEVDLSEGAHEVRLEYRTAPAFNLHVRAYQLGIGRPRDDADFAEAVEAARGADVAVVCVGRNAEWDTEGWDLPSMTLPGRQDDLVAAVAAVAKTTIVVLQTGGPVEMPWHDDVAAILQAWYPGQEAGHALADVLTGAVEPSGRLPQTFPRRLADAPTQGKGAEAYPGKNGRVVYAEGLGIGYRADGPAPLYPFGHGLGYTDIDITAVEAADDRVSVTVENRGARAGAQVVQLYVAPEAAPVPRPEAELKGFAKVRLEPGARAEVSFELPDRAFAWFDVAAQEWVASPGRYRLYAALSAADRRFSATIERTEEVRMAP